MHYDDKYFNIQQKCGILGAETCINKFVKFINPNDTILEFGCGGGYYLNKIKAKRKIGLEINPVAIKKAKEFGLEIYTSVKEIKDSSIDVIYSHHALEHLPNPHDALKELYKKLKDNGKIVFVVPFDPHFIHWKPNDRNQHLYTWNSMTAGNLFTLAGFKVIKIKYIRYQWPPGTSYIRKYLGLNFLNFASTIYAYLLGFREVQVIAQKAES
jgi:SAM-dependent methyltransferase